MLIFLDVCNPSTQSCSLSSALEQMGLADIMQIVRLMSLCAAGKMELSGGSGRSGESNKHLHHLTAAIGALIEEDPSALKQLVQLCTQVGISTMCLSVCLYVYYSVSLLI